MDYFDLFGEEWNDDMSLCTTKVHKNWKTKYNWEIEMSIDKYNYLNQTAKITKRKITDEEYKKVFSK